ncbi:hypothetical protein AURDEDRAFT_177159 [Auricularia subglabra TFB-10046 SS5]|uniref:Uncharacterized protein n=1 Tax=Auricularia subglabra (strain TFB-10046 / SS5) TaxID=717982 RepID=J0WN19_AURST|nr:hypothetical protein AURDEDRAFT_177159 [Auricularia subglabra TFB-10046 SS5]
MSIPGEDSLIGPDVKRRAGHVDFLAMVRSSKRHAVLSSRHSHLSSHVARQPDEVVPTIDRLPVPAVLTDPISHDLPPRDADNPETNSENTLGLSVAASTGDYASTPNTAPNDTQQPQPMGTASENRDLHADPSPVSPENHERKTAEDISDYSGMSIVPTPSTRTTNVLGSPIRTQSTLPSISTLSETGPLGDAGPRGEPTAEQEVSQTYPQPELTPEAHGVTPAYPYTIESQPRESMQLDGEESSGACLECREIVPIVLGAVEGGLPGPGNTFTNDSSRMEVDDEPDYMVATISPAHDIPLRNSGETLVGAEEPLGGRQDCLIGETPEGSEALELSPRLVIEDRVNECTADISTPGKTPGIDWPGPTHHGTLQTEDVDAVMSDTEAQDPASIRYDEPSATEDVDAVMSDTEAQDPASISITPAAPSSSSGKQQDERIPPELSLDPQRTPTAWFGPATQLESHIPSAQNALPGSNSDQLGTLKTFSFGRMRPQRDTAPSLSLPTIRGFSFAGLRKAQDPHAADTAALGMSKSFQSDGRLSTSQVDEDVMEEDWAESGEDNRKDSVLADVGLSEGDESSSEDDDLDVPLADMVTKFASLVDRAEAAVTGKDTDAVSSSTALKRDLRHVKASAKSLLNKLAQQQRAPEATSGVRQEVIRMKMAALEMKNDMRALRQAVTSQHEPKQLSSSAVKDPARAEFLAAIHGHFDEMLPSDDGVLPTARESEIRQFERMAKPTPGYGPTSQPLRVDFTSSGLESSKWNKAVATFFTRSFCAAHSQSSEDKVKSAFFTYLRHLRDVHRVALNGRMDKDEEASRRRRVYRRQETLNKQRLKVLDYYKSKYETLKALVPILKQLGKRGTSPDFSDHENVPRGKLTSDKPYKRQHLPWRSEDLTKLLHDLDAIYKYLRVRNGKRNGGNWPHVREDPDLPSIAEDAPAVESLPENCYDEVWRGSLADLSAFELRARPPVGTFTLPEPLQQIADRYRFVKCRADAPLEAQDGPGRRRAKKRPSGRPGKGVAVQPSPAEPPASGGAPGRTQTAEDRIPVASSSRVQLQPAITFGPWPEEFEHTMSAYQSVLRLINGLPEARSLTLPDAVAQDRNPQFAIAFFQNIEDRDRVFQATQRRTNLDIDAQPESLPAPAVGTFITAHIAKAVRARHPH